jgi:hypothetical protein
MLSHTRRQILKFSHSLCISRCRPLVTVNGISVKVVNNFNVKINVGQKQSDKSHDGLFDEAPADEPKAKRSFYLDLSPFDKMMDGQKLPLSDTLDRKKGIQFKFVNYDEQAKNLLDSHMRNTIIVATAGRYSSGKTTLLKMLFDGIVTDSNSEVGVNSTTQGIKFYEWPMRREGETKAIIMDTEGFDSPIGMGASETKRQQRLCREFMTNGIVRGLANISIYVTPQYTLRDELNIQSFVDGNPNAETIVVHNPHHLRNVDDINTYLNFFMQTYDHSVGIKPNQTQLQRFIDTMIHGITNAPAPGDAAPSHLGCDHVDIDNTDSVSTKHFFIFNESIGPHVKVWNENQLKQIRNLIRARQLRDLKSTFQQALENSFFGTLRNLTHVRYDNEDEFQRSQANDTTSPEKAGLWLLASEEDAPLTDEAEAAADEKERDLAIRMAKITAMPTSSAQGNIKGNSFNHKGCRLFMLECPCLPDDVIVRVTAQPQYQITIKYNTTINVVDKEFEKTKALEVVDPSMVSLLNSTAERNILAESTEQLDGAVAWTCHGQLYVFIPRTTRTKSSTHNSQMMSDWLNKKIENKEKGYSKVVVKIQLQGLDGDDLSDCEEEHSAVGSVIVEHEELGASSRS